MKRLMPMLCLMWNLPSPALAKAEREVFATYGLAPQAPLTRSSLDTSVGFTDPLTPELSLRYEYGFLKGDADSEASKTTYTYEGSNLREKKHVHFRFQTFSVGAQQTLFPNLIVWGSLLYAQVPGQLEIDRPLGYTESRTFVANSISSQFGLGGRWMLGDHCLIGLDLFILPIYLWSGTKISQDQSTSQAYNESLKADIDRPLKEVQDLRIFRAVLAFRF